MTPNDAEPGPTLLALDDLRVDLARQRVERAGVVLDVGGLSFQLLRYLLAQGDRVVGFDELIEQVWAPAHVNEETVTQRVKLLRQALGDDGRRPRYIRSVRGRGYQLCSAPRPAPAGAGTAAPAVRRRPRTAWLLAAAAFAAAAALGAWLLHAPAPAPPHAMSAREELLQRAAYYAGIGQNDNNERAIALYEEVLRDDRDDAKAAVGLSRALSARMCLYNGPPDAAQRAQALAEAVIARHADDAAAYSALAYSYDCRGDVDAATGAYEKALALDPTRADSRASVAHLYLVRGRLAEALEGNVAAEKSGAALRFLDLQFARNLELLGFVAEAEERYARLFRLYPDNVYGNAAYPRFLFVQGRYSEAEAVLAEAMRRPRHPDLLLLAGELALLRGDAAQAAASFAQASALRPHQSLPRTLVRLYATPPADRDWAAAQAAAIAKESAGDVPEAWIEVALLRRHAGNVAGAIEALNQAVAAGFRDRAWLQGTPLLRDLAGEPGFAGVVDAIGRRVAEERGRVLAAAWLPPGLVSAKPAAPPG